MRPGSFHLLPPGAAALLLLLLLLLGGCAGGTSSHSVKVQVGVWNSAEGLPQFMGLGYLDDDQLFVRREQKMRQFVPLVPWMEKLVKDDPEYWRLYTQHTSGLEEMLNQQVVMVQKYGNQSEGFFTWQGICSCELREDGQKLGSMHYGYNGRDFISFNKDTISWTIVANATAPEFKKKWDSITAAPQYYKDYLEEECIDWMQKYIKYAKESLLKREPPVVKVQRRVNHNGLETLFCRAYGFYPRKIFITWKKDGEFLEQETLPGEVAPNSDGTYHTWISIEIDPKDRDHYLCHVEHAGFSEPSLFALKEPGLLGTILGSILGAVTAAGVLLVAGIIFYIKKQHGGYKAVTVFHLQQRKDSEWQETELS